MTEAPKEPSAIDLLDPRSEAQIQSAVTNSLLSMGMKVWSLSQRRATQQTEGLGDLYTTGRGICLWIETKSATGTQSDEQRDFMAAVQGNGGLYAVIRHENAVAELVERLASA